MVESDYIYISSVLFVLFALLVCCIFFGRLGGRRIGWRGWVVGGADCVINPLEKEYSFLVAK